MHDSDETFMGGVRLAVKRCFVIWDSANVALYAIVASRRCGLRHIVNTIMATQE